MVIVDSVSCSRKVHSNTSPRGIEGVESGADVCQLPALFSPENLERSRDSFGTENGAFLGGL